MNAKRNKDPEDDAKAGEEGKGGKRRRKLLDLRAYFLTGLVVAAPILITVYLAVSFVNFVDGQVSGILPPRYNPETYLPFTVPGIGVAIVFTFLVLLGAFTANVVGRFFIRQGERIVAHMPVIRSIYGALKQIFETVLAQSSQNFQQVCLVEYPRRGMWAVGFVISATKGEIQDRSDEEMISVFIPTTPNPTSGFLVFVAKQDLVILDMTIEEGAKMVISGGLVAPDFDPSQARAKSRIPPSLDHVAAERIRAEPPRPDEAAVMEATEARLAAAAEAAAAKTAETEAESPPDPPRKSGRGLFGRRREKEKAETDA